MEVASLSVELIYRSMQRDIAGVGRLDLAASTRCKEAGQEQHGEEHNTDEN